MKKTQIMGILNINSDSFFEKSRVNIHLAQEKIENMIDDGADIIDIGGLSSRPESDTISEEEEFKRVKDIIDIVYKNRYFEKVIFSLDSYSVLCLDYALSNGFKIVNDITGLENDDVCKIAKKHNATVCIMHMKGNPKDMQKDPKYEDVVKEVDSFFAYRIEKAKSFGIKDIILDVGIGFGKNLEHNIKLIKQQKHFLHFGFPLLIGVSRKSMIDKISPSKIEDRLPGTLIAHFEAVRNGASIVRCHDVKEHIQALKVFEALGG
ncbi:MAG: dihydropteroate synthase [Campylobacteraceae bacterium]|jgi:dihydropteroate synthase|nr:dihydropteroate synthase [Campylobacteraceae bacterium]